MARGLAAFGSNDDERDASDQGDGAEDRGNGHGVRLLVRDLQRAKVDVFLFVGEAEATDGKSDDSDDDQDKANECGRFHRVKILLEIFLFI